MDRAVITRHFYWETDKDGLAWLTFDKQGESANTFSKEALNAARRLPRRDQGRLAQGPHHPLGEGQLHRRRRRRGVHPLQDAAGGARVRAPGLGRAAEAARAALPHHRDGQRLLHGRRRRAGARLPLPRRARRPEDALRAARGDARHHAGVARRAVAAEAGRAGGRVRHDPHRQVDRRAAREAHGPGRPGGAAAHPREHGAHRHAGSQAEEEASASPKESCWLEIGGRLAGAGSRSRGARGRSTTPRPTRSSSCGASTTATRSPRRTTPTPRSRRCSRIPPPPT